MGETTRVKEEARHHGDIAAKRASLQEAKIERADANGKASDARYEADLGVGAKRSKEEEGGANECSRNFLLQKVTYCIIFLKCTYFSSVSVISNSLRLRKMEL